MYHYILIIALIILISFIYIYDIRIENMDVKYKCPEKLEINKNGGFTLFENKKYQDIQSLDEYIRIIDWQKKNNINCPILALNMNKTDLAPAELIPQEEGEKIHLLMDGNRDDNTYNTNQYPGFDAHNLYIGMNTPLDVLHKLEQYKEKSANPMDSNWGGNVYTSNLVNSGFYRENSR